MDGEKKEYVFPDTATMTLSDYVRRRFCDMPPGFSKFLDLGTSDTARVHLEGLFRAEYYRFRCLLEDRLLSELYRNHEAAKVVIEKLKSLLDLCTDDDIEVMWSSALEQIGDMSEIPTGFGWKDKESTNG